MTDIMARIEFIICKILDWIMETTEFLASLGFNKHSATLFSKGHNLAEDFSAHVAVVAFSPSSEPHAFGGPIVDSILCAYLPGPAAAPPLASASPGWPRAKMVEEAAARVAGIRWRLEDTEVLVASEYALLAAATRKIKAVQASMGKRNWWEVDVDALGEEELSVFIKALEMLRTEVQGRINVMASVWQRLPQCK
ncbi:agamous-like MADS-box protein AGL61 [Setaria viridis]|uniref:agamous-like MADS-box protein AGL61 n=1 Tax=Setaria viridis TaxID=4556 RepID=UPI00149367F1|nr:agamous-like MADS-box protein AGL62 [Setaria viridis]